MRPETRQTLLGVFCLSVVELVALSQGFDGRVLITYLLAVVALISPQVIPSLPITLKEGSD